MNSLFRSSVLNFLSQLIIFSSSAVISIFLARFLGPENLGQYSYWMWLIGTGALIFTLGLPRSIVRFVAQYKSKKNTSAQIISRILISQIKLLAAFCSISFLLIFLFGGADKLIYFIIALTLSVSVLNSLLGSALFGLQKYGFLFKVNILTSASSFILILLVLLSSSNITILLLVNLFVIIISSLISFYFLKDLIDLKAAVLPSKLYKEIKNYSLSISAIVLLDIILMERSEIFFLKNFSTLEQVAFYSVSFALVGRVMTLIPGAVSGVIMPKIAWLHGKKEKANISLTYFISTRYLILITFPIIFAGIALIDLPIKFFYGDNYLPVVPVIRILLISGGLSAIVASAAAVVYGTGRQKFILKLALAAAAINILFDFLLIPPYGAVGAALANAIAQIFGSIIGTYYLVFINKMSFPWNSAIKIILASAISLLTILIFRQVIIFSEIFSLIILSALFIVMYFISLKFLNFFNKQDNDVLNKISVKFPLLKFIRL